MLLLSKQGPPTCLLEKACVQKCIPGANGWVLYDGTWHDHKILNTSLLLITIMIRNFLLVLFYQNSSIFFKTVSYKKKPVIITVRLFLWKLRVIKILIRWSTNPTEQPLTWRTREFLLSSPSPGGLPSLLLMIFLCPCLYLELSSSSLA